MQQDKAGDATPAGLHAAPHDVPQDAPLELRLVVPVDANRTSLRAAKAELRTTLATWQVDERTANAAYDVAHELLTNAVQHAAAPIQLSAHATSDLVRVQVDDASREPARMLPYRAGYSEHGLGLRLVQQLSAQWGQRIAENGKSVWATFQRRPSGRGEAQP